MDLDMVLNELSLGSPASNVQTARQQMSNLTETARLAAKHGVKKAIRVRSQFYSANLAPNYSVSHWLRDRSVGIEERRFLRTSISKSPLLDEPQESEIEEKRLLSDFFYNEERAEGLGLAYLSESLALSMRTEPPDPLWEPSILELQHEWIEEDGDSSNSETVEVVHASQVGHIQEHIPWIQERLKTSVSDGLDLWQRKNALFPNLEFCENARRQIEDLNYGDKMLRPVVKRLLQLEQYCKTWETGAFDPNSLPSKATEESKETLGDRKLREQRTFRCPDGEDRVFSWHIRLTPGAWRIYFWPEGGKMIIGYIGSKIPTIKYPTP